MTTEDRQALVKVLRLLKQLYFRNLALEVIAEKFGPAGWNQLADKLANDESLHPEVREAFLLKVAELERDSDPTQKALLDFLLSLPAKGKPN
jgi:hypothetical protein